MLRSVAPQRHWSFIRALARVTFGWASLAVLVVVVWYPSIISNRTGTNQSHQRRTTTTLEQQHISQNFDPTPQRILYIVTSIAEYDNGFRSTQAGNDRFTNTLVPILTASVQSIIRQSSSSSSSNHYNFTVDVYLITHYPVTPQRYQQLRTALPQQVGLQIWDGATPYGYIQDSPWSFSNRTTTTAKTRSTLSPSQLQSRLQYHTRGLSRQHRFVIKDKLYYYDYFINVEDDMFIHHDHVQHYVQMTNTIYQLRRHSSSRQHHDRQNHDPMEQFYGPMTEHQLGRTIPGFLRVEVVINDSTKTTTTKDYSQDDAIHPLFRYFQQHPIAKNHLQTLYHNIPRDYSYSDSEDHPHHYPNTTTVVVDASICCDLTTHVSTSQSSPPHTGHDLYFWEMSLESLGVRHMPELIVAVTTKTTAPSHPQRSLTNPMASNNNNILNDLDWVMLLGGSNNELFIKLNDPSYIIGDYWSGQYLIDTTESASAKLQRPDRKKGKYVTNQGGWFGTRRQIIEWHTQWCRGSFLPPYDLPIYRLDGLDGRSVEYWSGGIQLVGINACNLQRIVALRPEYFSKHLLYHTSNNKQNSSPVQYRFSRRSINEFWGQINTIRKHAERSMNQELGVL